MDALRLTEEFEKMMYEITEYSDSNTDLQERVVFAETGDKFGFRDMCMRDEWTYKVDIDYYSPKKEKVENFSEEYEF